MYKHLRSWWCGKKVGYFPSRLRRIASPVFLFWMCGHDINFVEHWLQYFMFFCITENDNERIYSQTERNETYENKLCNSVIEVSLHRTFALLSVKIVEWNVAENKPIVLKAFENINSIFDRIYHQPLIQFIQSIQSAGIFPII